MLAKIIKKNTHKPMHTVAMIMAAACLIEALIASQCAHSRVQRQHGAIEQRAEVHKQAAPSTA